MVGGKHDIEGSPAVGTIHMSSLRDSGWEVPPPILQPLKF